MKTLLQQLLAIENFDVYLVLGILIGFGLIESFAGYLRNSKRKKGDWLVRMIDLSIDSQYFRITNADILNYNMIQYSQNHQYV